MGRENSLLRVAHRAVAGGRVQIDVEEAVVVVMIIDSQRVGQVGVDHLDVVVERYRVVLTA